MSEPILPFITTNDVGKSEATVVKVDGREIKKNPIDVGEDGLRILQIIAGVISASTKSLGSSIRHIFLENGKLSVSTADVGSSKKPVYMSNGEVKASDANVGSRVKPVYMEGGEIKESNANVGDDGLRLLKMVNGELQVSTSSKGSNIKFVYVQNGEVKETSVTLGSGIKHIYLQDGELKVSDSSVGGKIEVYDATADENPVAGKHYFKREADNTYTDITSELSTDADLQSMGYTVFELKETKFAPAVLKGGSIAVDDANVGSNACFIYMQNGELRASTLTAGTNAKLLKIVNGEVKEATDNIGGDGRIIKIVNGQIVGDESTTVGDGSSIVYLSEGKLVKSTDTVGSDSKPVKLDNGSLVPVAKDLATKEAPALERAGEPRPDSELSEAEKLVPTSPTPTASDPGSMIATKEYVDNFSTESATYGYGVVDGSICTDAGDNLCITTISVDTTTEEVEYEVQNDCYLYIEVNGVTDISSDDNADYATVLVNDKEVGRLMDPVGASQDQPSFGIPVAKGSTVKITCSYQLVHIGTGNIRFTEYRLAPISPSIEMPKYNKDEAFDIHIAAFSEEGYLAPRRGYLLASIFDERGVYVPSEKSMKIYINDILVMNGRNIVKQVLIDSILDDPSLISKNAGSVKKQTVTREANTIELDNPDNFKVYTIDVNPATDKYEYIAALNPGTVTDGVLTFDESLINYDVVVVDGVRQIEDIKLTDTGSCLIPVNYHDVIKIRAEKNGTDEFGSAATWPSNFVYTVTSDTTPEVTKRYYKETSDGMIDITEELLGSGADISTLGYTVYEGTYVDANHDGTTDTTEHRWQAIFLKTRHHVASSDDDPINKDQFILGGFMTGELFKDSSGNDLVTLVPYTQWASTQDADNLYTYKYIVNKDCMLYMSFLVHAHSTSPDKVKITLNGKEFDYYYENDATLGTTISDSDKQLMLPITAGTVVGFHSKAQPNHNIIGTADSGTGTYAIKIKEYMLVAGGNVSDISQLQVGGGVIDGTLCTDTQGHPCITEIDLTTAGNNRPSYVYRTTRDCLLVVEVAKALIGTEYNHIDVKVNGKVVGVFTDNSSTDDDNDNIRIPVRAGSDVELVGDGTNNIFGSTPAGSFIRFTEYKLTSITRQIGLPNYDRGVDITSYVTRTTLTESRGYKAETDGYVLFQANTLSQSCVLHGVVANVQVYKSGFRQSESDFFNNNGIVPVREGDEIDFSITNSDGSSLVPMTGSAAPKVMFFPLAGTVNFDRYPNGVAPNSKMVRQEDMNLKVSTATGAGSYSNEITITESGICQIYANFDADVSPADSVYGTSVEAFIGNEWKVVDCDYYRTSPPSQAGSCFWRFSFPVEADLKIRMHTTFDVSVAQPALVGNVGFYPYTNGQQAICWVIPTFKFFNPEQNLPGSAGVIDGSIWKKADGTDEVTTLRGTEATGLADNGVLNSDTKVLTYHVKNDCYLYIQVDQPGSSLDIGGSMYHNVVCVNGVDVGRLLDHDSVSQGTNDAPSIGINVARGSVVTIKHAKSNEPLFTYMNSTDDSITFTEFKLRATNVVAAMPDWDDAKKVPITYGELVPADGWIVPKVDDSTTFGGNYSGRVYINGVEVYYWSWEVDGDNNTQTTCIPVTKGDKVTYKTNDANGDSTGRLSITFYPVKMHEIKSEVVEAAIDVLSKVNEVTLVDAAANSDIFNAAQALMTNTAIAPSTNDGTNDHPAGQFPVPEWAGYDTVVKFMKGVTEAELRTMTGNSLLSLRNADIEIKLVTYSLSGGGTFETVEQYEEIDPLVYVGNSNTGPRNIVSTIKPIISKVGSDRTIRVPWPSKFATNSTSHWATDSSTFFPAQYGDLIALGSSIRARVVLVIKQRSSSSGS